MAKGNPLQQQLLKAGLVKKSRVAEVVREQHKARHGKGPAKPSQTVLAAQRARAEKAERDRALAAERKAQARTAELRAQARQIIQDKKLPVIARLGDRYELLPRPAADKVRERDPDMIVLDHGQDADAKPAATSSEDDAYYAQFQVPDDLGW